VCTMVSFENQQVSMPKGEEIVWALLKEQEFCVSTLKQPS